MSIFKKYQLYLILLLLLINFIYIGNAIVNYYYISSDGINIISFPIAKTVGIDKFEKDLILNNPKLYDWYTPFYLWILKSLWLLFGQNTYMAFWFQIFFIVNLFFVGLYLLGSKLFENRLIQFLFILTGFIFIKSPFGGGWGIPFKSPRPQIMFIAFIPWMFYLFYLVIENKNKYIEYIYPLFVGLLIYIHPVSAPYFIVGFFFSYVYIVYSKEKNLYILIKKSLIYILITVIAVFPYLIVYLKKYLISNSDVDYELYKKVAMMRFNKFTFKINRLFYQYIKMLPFETYIMFFFNLGYLIKQLIAKRKILWSIIIFILFSTLISFSYILPKIDYYFSFKLKKIPFQVDFPRNIIFFPFLIILLFFYFISIEVKKIKKRYFYYFVNIVIVLFISNMFLKGFVFEKRNFIVSRFINNYGIDFSKRYSPIRTMSVLLNKTVKEKESIFPFFISTSTAFPRSLNILPVSYSYKDGGVILYSGIKSYISKWFRITNSLKYYLKQSERLFERNIYKVNLENKIMGLAKEINADYILTYKKPLNLLMNNYDFVLINDSILIKVKDDFDLKKNYSMLEPCSFTYKDGILFIKRNQLKEELYFLTFKVKINSKRDFEFLDLLNWKVKTVDGVKYAFNNKLIVKTREYLFIKSYVYFSEDMINRLIKFKLLNNRVPNSIKEINLYKVKL